MLSYDTVDLTYTYSRIKDSFVVHNNSLGFVRGLAANGDVELAIYPSPNKEVTTFVPIKDININPPPLGYVNFGDNLNYISRLPQRGTYKQGICYNALTSVCGLRPIDIPPFYLHNAVFGARPDFQSACRGLEKHSIECSWDKNWGIARGNLVIYKGEDQVGEVKSSSNGEYSCVLYPEYDYLQDELEESYARSCA